MVFCSHSMFHIQELCDTAIWIDKGKIREMGDSDKVVGHYEDFCNNKKSITPSVMTCLKSWNRRNRGRIAQPRTAGSIHSR